MTKKPSATMKSNKTTRLGHDPFADIEPSIEDEEVLQNKNIEADTNPDKQDGEKNDNKETLHLPLRFLIASAEEVYKSMSSFLSSEQNCIEVDPQKTESVDTSAIQLLYAFILQTKIAGKTIRWKSHSKIIDDAANILNINISNDKD